jgi:acetyl-CoA carboxylase/biotin carboxylase 1
VDDKIGQIATWHFYSDASEVADTSADAVAASMVAPGSSVNLQALLGVDIQQKPLPASATSSGSGEDVDEDSSSLGGADFGGMSKSSSKRPRGLMKQKSSRARAGSGWENEMGDDVMSLKSEADSTELSRTPSVMGLLDSIATPQDQYQVGGKFSGGEGVPANIVRHGILAYFDGMEAMRANFEILLEQFDTTTQMSAKQTVNALHIVFREQQDAAAHTSTVDEKKAGLSGEETTALRLATFLGENQVILRKAGVRRVTLAVPSFSLSRHMIVAGYGSGYFTFRERSNYQEDRLVRHIETPLAFQLELKRLSNFNITLVPLGKTHSVAHTVHLYQATPKKVEATRAADDDGEGGAGARDTQKRYFVRALVRQSSKIQVETTGKPSDTVVDAYPGPERVLVQALAALEAVQGRGGASAAGGAHNHIFLNVLGDTAVDPVFVERACRMIARRYARRLVTARVAEVELKFNARLDNESPLIPVRIVTSNPTGFALRVDSYIEAADPLNPNRNLFYSISAQDGGVGASLAAMGLDLGSTGSTSSSSASTDMFSHFDPIENDADIEGLQSTSSVSVTGLGKLHGLDSTTPYPVSSPFEERRARAVVSGTCFVYDIPALFQKALENQWRTYSRRRDHVAMPPSSSLLRVQEVVLDDEMDANGSALGSSGLVFTSRPPASNKIAMVAWHFQMITPQYSGANGREVIVIANDLTFKAGSFGTREDELFGRASKYARERGIPRLYIAANSGARIGIAEEVKRVFKAKWVDESDPAKGFSYLYIDTNEYKLLGPEGRKSVIAEPVTSSNESGASSSKILHYRLTAIVGEGRDLGVENLRGSGMIAGETSRAYCETFTATYVAGRTVGIGAYLVRLGQRTIQKGTNAPIILTGYQALNSLMGRTVYSSNAQLGGPAIMFNNGVTHLCVRDDLEGISSLLTWLTYVPEKRGAQLPITSLTTGDSIDRDVEYMPSAEIVSDPRLLLTGIEPTSPGANWISGLFDRGSWMELLGGWAKTIVTGRARLGCLPVGVIIPESRTVECKKPADPATIDSKETVIMQAGNVWFPDSSFKTAQAIRDINNEGLPLIFIANFRGFSGGQRDMFDEVLKYGSMIVDALVEFSQPVLVYLPPFGELRGGAWVVMDATINEDMMEMYAAPEARGGVLEPAGTVSIKFRPKDMVTAMHRIDPTIIELDSKLAKADEAQANPEEVKALRTQIEQRERRLLPVYKQLALEVADLHDRPGRMMAKKVISGVVPWRDARRVFYWRLHRRLAEDAVCKSLMREGDLSTLKVARETLKKVGEVAIAGASHISWNTGDREVVEWIQSPQGARSIDSIRTALRQERIVKQITELGLEDGTAVLKGVMGVIQALGQNGRITDRDQFVQTLRRGVFLLGSGASTSAATPPSQ